MDRHYRIKKFKTFFISIAKLLTLRWFLVPTIIVFLALGLFIALKSYIAPLPTEFSQRKEFIQLLAQILGGALLLIGLYLTWRRVEVAQEGQITERFTRAIDQLGSEKLEVRLGGIYALERIARDSKKDHWQIMEILTAYIRENAPSNPKKKIISLLPTDIQAILTVLGRRARTFGKGENEILNLSNTNLQQADLIGAHLERADLRGVRLEGANLIGAHMEGADLRGAHLEKACLLEAHLEGTALLKAHLKKADLRGAHLAGAFLDRAYLNKADLIEAHLEHVTLVEAHLEKADLEGTHLEDACLIGATGLTREQIKVAIANKDTMLPDYLKAPAKAKKRRKQEGKKKGTTSKRQQSMK
jgi:uncharacterized protein YjbI with pentapeptide repeats